MVEVIIYLNTRGSTLRLLGYNWYQQTKIFSLGATTTVVISFSFVGYSQSTNMALITVKTQTLENVPRLTKIFFIRLAKSNLLITKPVVIVLPILTNVDI